MDHHVRVAYLLTFYGKVLTPRQQEMMRLTYEEDWSLSEIASAFEVSRQAVHDALRRAEASMEELDQSMGLIERILEVERELEDCLALTESPEVRQKLRHTLEVLKGEDNHGL